MATRACDQCGQSYEAKRPTSKFCSSGCRTRRARGVEPAGRVVALPAAASSTSPAGANAAAVRERLSAAGRLGSPEGVAALTLAGLLDGGGHTAAGAAALAKQLLATVAAAVGDVPAAADRLDELAARRAGKTGA